MLRGPCRTPAPVFLQTSGQFLLKQAADKMRGVRVGRPEMLALERVGLRASSQPRSLAFSKHGTAGRHEAGRSTHQTPEFPAAPRGTALRADWNRSMSDRVNRRAENFGGVNDDHTPRDDDLANQACVLSLASGRVSGAACTPAPTASRHLPWRL